MSSSPSNELRTKCRNTVIRPGHFCIYYIQNSHVDECPRCECIETTLDQQCAITLKQGLKPMCRTMIPSGVITTKMARTRNRRLRSAPATCTLTMRAKAAEPLWDRMAIMTSREAATSVAPVPGRYRAIMEWIDKTTSKTRG